MAISHDSTLILTQPHLYSVLLSVHFHSQSGMVCLIQGILLSAIMTQLCVESDITNMPTLKIIVCLQALPLHQLLLSKNSRALDKIAKNVSILDRWPPSLVIFEICHISEAYTYPRSRSVQLPVST